MSRLLRILTMTVGGLAIFAVFALAGWAITDLLASQDEVDGLETVALTEYPLQPAEDDIEEQLARSGDEQELTDQGLSNTSDVEVSDTVERQGSLGSAAAGGQTVRLVERSTIEFGGSSPDGSSTTTTDTGVEPGPGSDEPIPGDLFEDLPRLLGGLDLTDIQVADPVGPILIDLCAGPERLPESPEGCSFGFGGTILAVELDDDPTYGVAVFLASEDRCETTDDTIMSLVVGTAVPGTVSLTLWQGAPDSDPPPGAFFAQYESPAELSETLTAALDAGEATTGFFCIEVPNMTGELVAEHFLVSSYPPHGGALGPVFRDPLTSRSGRPPSAMTAFGSDALYVRIHRAVNEEVWVKAVEIDLTTPASAVCDTGGREVGARGPTPNGMLEADVVGGLVYTTSIEIDETWPYGEAFTTVDVHLLNFEAGRNYAICSYVVSTNPFGEVTHSEAAVVGTPTSRGLDVKMVGAGGTGESSVELVGFELATPCGTFPIEYPGQGVHVQYNQNICRSDFLVSNVIRDRGFGVTIYTRTTEDRDDVVTREWIPVDRNDILCGTACDGDREFVVRLPVHGFDLTESRRTRISVGYLDLVVTLTAADPGGSTSWDLGTPDPYDNADPVLPEYPRVNARLVSTPVDLDANGTPSAGMRIEVYADRPVDYTAEIDPSFPTCEGTRAPITEGMGTASPGGSGSIFQPVGLCIGVRYPITIEVTDAEGNLTTETFEFFTDTSQTFTMRAELQLESLPGLRTGTDWHQTFRKLTATNEPSWPVRGAAGGIFDSIAQRFLTGEAVLAIQEWKRTSDRGIHGPNACDGSAIPPGPEIWRIDNIPVRSLDWGVSTTVIRANYNRNSDGPDCQPGRANPTAPLNIEIVEIVRLAASGLTLEELLQGVVITTETAYGTPSLRVWAVLGSRR